MPEHQNIEYKQLWHDDNLKTVCALAKGASQFLKGTGQDPQRGSVLQPKVARVCEGYLGYRQTTIINPNGVLSSVACHRAQPRWGCELLSSLSQGRLLRRQPWTEGHNAVGVEPADTNTKPKPSPTVSKNEMCPFANAQRGITKITEACKAAGLPPPKLEENSGGFLVTLTAPATPQVTGQVTGQVTPEVMRMLSAIEGEQTRSQIQKTLGLTEKVGLNAK